MPFRQAVNSADAVIGSCQVGRQEGTADDGIGGEIVRTSAESGSVTASCYRFSNAQRRHHVIQQRQSGVKLAASYPFTEGIPFRRRKPDNFRQMRQIARSMVLSSGSVGWVTGKMAATYCSPSSVMPLRKERRC